MTIDAILLNDRRHAVVVISGHAGPGCGPSLADSLQVCARSHTVVDLRQVTGISPEMVKSLLLALGQALDHGRTLRAVVRDDHQRRFLHSVGLGTMMPLHVSIAEAMTAADAVAPRATPYRPAPRP